MGPYFSSPLNVLFKHFSRKIANFQGKLKNQALFKRTVKFKHFSRSVGTMSRFLINTLRLRHFPDDIFQCISSNENVWISIKISLKFVPQDPINNIPALVQIMTWCCPGYKPLSEPMMVGLPMHICITRSKWVNSLNHWWLFTIAIHKEIWFLPCTGGSHGNLITIDQSHRCGRR